MPPSYDMAYKRLVNVEKKMKRNGQFAQAYRLSQARFDWSSTLQPKLEEHR